MDLVNGDSLARRGAAHRPGLGEVIDWAAQICEALDHAHGRGVIHCDLKPANLLLDESGRVRVTDFGLSRLLTETSDVRSAIEGTAPFMAPEQGSPSWGVIDCRTDVFGLGAVMYWLLCGQPPWPGSSLSELLKLVTGPVPVVRLQDVRPELPARVSGLCMKCLAKQPAARFQSVGDLRAALRAVAESG
jgi:serine/threonine-protein kinase